MEATTDRRVSDETNWKLAGIRDERGRLEQRLKYLQDEEKRVTDQAMTGTGRTNGKTATSKTTAKSAAPVRQRKITAEQRKKMSDAAKKRWAERKNGTTQGAATTEVPPPVETA